MKKVKNIAFCLALFCLSVGLGAQAPLWEWAAGAGGLYSDNGNAIAIDAQGNLYVTGSFQGTASFGLYTVTSSGNYDIFAAKLDPNGNFLWAVRAGGAWPDRGYGIAVDGAGYIWLTGSFWGSAAFGPYTLTSGGTHDVFAAKLDGAGNWLWAVRAGGTDWDIPNSIAADGSGNACLAGYIRGTAGFGPYTLTCSGPYDIFAAKLDPNGNFLWAVRAGGTSSDQAIGIAVDGAGSPCLTGYFSGGADFGPYTLTSSGNYDIFAARLDQAGNWLWAIRAGGTGADQGSGICTDGAGNVFLTGYFAGSSDFGSYTLTPDGYCDIFAAKLDPAGNWLWAVQAGGANEDYGNGIAVDGSGNSRVVGKFAGSAAFGPYAVTSDGSNDICAAQLDGDGNWLWAVRAGGTGDDLGCGIVVDGGGNSYLTGIFNGSADFGSIALNSNGGWDVFAAKLKKPLTADFSAEPTLGSVPLTVQFTDLSNAGLVPIANWIWVFGDGGSSLEQNPVHTYQNPGIYTVSLTVMDQNYQTSNLVRPDYITAVDEQSVPPATPENVRVEIAGNDAVISWDAVTQNIYGEPSTPDFYVVLCSEWPYAGEGHTFSYLASSTGLFVVHTGAAATHVSMFYMVKAVKSYRDAWLREQFKPGMPEEEVFRLCRSLDR